MFLACPNCHRDTDLDDSKIAELLDMEELLVTCRICGKGIRLNLDIEKDD